MVGIKHILGELLSILRPTGSWMRYHQTIKRDVNHWCLMSCPPTLRLAIACLRQLLQLPALSQGSGQRDTIRRASREDGKRS